MTTHASAVENDPRLIASESFARAYLAFLDCSDEVQALIRELSCSLTDPELSAYDRHLIVASITEALFPPPSGPDGHCGFDLEREEKDASGDESALLDQMEEEEAGFAKCVEHLLRERGMTQGQLAEAIGVKQPAISMMLSRKARPQHRTVLKIAHALNVPAESLWPDALR